MIIIRFSRFILFVIKGIIMRISLLLPTILAGVFAINSFVLASDESPTILVIHNHQFDPSKLTIPSGTKVKIVVRNQDAMPAEFESYDLSREVVVPGHGEATFYIGPLESGTYQFFNDFNHDMQGSIVAKPAVNKGN
ncbi:MAG TPA: cupredoxin domain-containing protein [Gallionellaceae bacterium]|nr:cupredoxin domain-containing protein [Gallionellaceae bacterium]